MRRDDDDGEMSALVAATYQSHSSDIVDVLTDSLNKAQTGFDDTLHAETTVAKNSTLLKQPGVNSDEFISAQA